MSSVCIRDKFYFRGAMTVGSGKKPNVSFISVSDCIPVNHFVWQMNEQTIQSYRSHVNYVLSCKHF